jgi:hypothetical protein
MRRDVTQSITDWRQLGHVKNAKRLAKNAMQDADRKSGGGIGAGVGERLIGKISLAIFASDLVVLILPRLAACAIDYAWPRNARSARPAFAALVASQRQYERS